MWLEQLGRWKGRKGSDLAQGHAVRPRGCSQKASGAPEGSEHNRPRPEGALEVSVCRMPMCQGQGCELTAGPG